MVVFILRKNHFRAMGALLLILLSGLISIHLFARSPLQNAAACEAGSPVSLQAEIFDIVQGKVVKTVPLNKTILSEARKCLQGIDGVYTKVNAFPDKGYIIKIPFESDTVIKNPILSKSGLASIDKVFILLPEQGAPYLLILDGQERPFFFVFSHPVKKLVNSLGLEMEQVPQPDR